MSALVFYFALSIAVAGGQASPPTPHPTLSQQLGCPIPGQAQISELQARAEQGDASAQCSLGKAYEEGDGVSRNYELAIKWYRKAADQENPTAETKMGLMYRLGLGVDRDKEAAVRWYHKAANLGDSDAMFNLGASYYNGDGVPVDPNLSYAWFLLAPEAGNLAAGDAVKRGAEEGGSRGTADALRLVAAMYEAGTELPKDSVQALKWYRKAADAGDASSAVKVAALVLGSGRTITGDDYAEARRRCQHAANQKYAPGAYCLAVIRQRGLGVRKDPTESAKWFMRAAELGDPRAAFALGEAYWKGDGVKADPVTAYMWMWLSYRARVPGRTSSLSGAL